MQFEVKRDENGAVLVNLACGTRMHRDWNNVDFSPYTSLRRYMWAARLLRSANFISDARWRRLNEVDPDIIRWDIRKGIPFPDASVDLLYHSHFLEHLSRETVPVFLKECYRVLKTDGFLRVVVPDLEKKVNKYVEVIHNLESNESDIETWKTYDLAVFDLFDQIVRKEAVGASQQKWLTMIIERTLRGGPEKTGELHRWIYDQYSLQRLLIQSAFENVLRMDYKTSLEKNWHHYKLDEDNRGNEYKPGSLYLEAVKRV